MRRRFNLLLALGLIAAANACTATLDFDRAYTGDAELSADAAETPPAADGGGRDADVPRADADRSTRPDAAHHGDGGAVGPDSGQEDAYLPALDAAPHQPDRGLPDAGPVDAHAHDVAPADASCVPSPEVCDGFDNDCDGEVDEDCPPQRGPCVLRGIAAASLHVQHPELHEICNAEGALLPDGEAAGLPRTREDGFLFLPEVEGAGDVLNGVAACVAVDLGREIETDEIVFRMASVEATCGAACCCGACGTGLFYAVVLSRDGNAFEIVDRDSDFSPDAVAHHRLPLRVRLRYLGVCRTAEGRSRNYVEVDYLAAVVSEPDVPDRDGDGICDPQ